MACSVLSKVNFFPFCVFLYKQHFLFFSSISHRLYFSVYFSSLSLSNFLKCYIVHWQHVVLKMLILSPRCQYLSSPRTWRDWFLLCLCFHSFEPLLHSLRRTHLTALQQWVGRWERCGGEEQTRESLGRRKVRKRRGDIETRMRRH